MQFFYRYIIISAFLTPWLSSASQPKLPTIKPVSTRYTGITIDKPKPSISTAGSIKRPTSSKQQPRIEQPKKETFERRSRCTEGTYAEPSTTKPAIRSYMEDYIHISNLLSKRSWGYNPAEIQKAIVRKIEQSKKLISACGTPSTIATFIPLFEDLENHPKLNQIFHDASTDEKTQ